jgi:glycosyltransferase involved in cell wall biosynthesis
MRKVVHLIPYDGIGGVEEAARTMSGAKKNDIIFELRWLFPKVTSARQRFATHNPLRILRVGVEISRDTPKILIVSLWRAAIAGIVAKLLSPRIKLVLFIHNSKDAHFLDFLVTRIAAWLADAIWADSETSLRMRFGKNPKRPATVISFLVRRLSPIQDEKNSAPRPVFAFWGRLTAQKNLMRALEIFSRIKAYRSDAEFYIIGPDGGDEEMLRAHAAEIGLQESVHFLGPMSFADIPEAVSGASFYLQSSDYEGMALAVTEAMQMGLVPVVTPVGEIACYCRDKENALIIRDDEQTAKEVIEILGVPGKYPDIRGQALTTWANAPLYEDSVFDALQSIAVRKRVRSSP